MGHSVVKPAVEILLEMTSKYCAFATFLNFITHKHVFQKTLQV
jgi:hypothetical protein